MAIYYIDLERDFQMMEMKNQEAKLYPLTNIEANTSIQEIIGHQRELIT